MRFRATAGSRLSRPSGPFLTGAVLLALGVVLAAATRSSPTGPVAAVALAAAPSDRPVPSDPPLGRRLDRSMIYPAEVLRVIDGDTFEARVLVWPGLDVETRVRLRGVDAAELHARCSDELAKALAARAALQAILAEGGVTVSQVGVDKYGGRVDAATATRGTADVSAAMLRGGFARAYGGGRRGSWCG